MNDLERIREITAELRALELVAVLRRAVTGEPHWRLEARQLLQLIDGGILPYRRELSHHKDAA